MKTTKQFHKLVVGMLCLASMLLFAGCSASTGSKELTYTLSEDGSHYEVFAERDKNLETTSITVPKTYKDKPVVLTTEAFYGLPALENVVIEGVDGTIPADTFMNCPQLKEVVIKGSATVGSRCFRSCQSLESITFGDGVKTIESDCLVDCPNIASIVLGKDLTEIGAGAFSHCAKLTEVVFPTENELVIGDYAFEYCGILELKIPANVKLGTYAFGHLAWGVSNEGKDVSKCKAAYFYSTEPTKEYLGTNSIGFTWDRKAEDDKELGDFIIYVPEGYEDVYETLMLEECDESWARCVLNENRLATFNPDEYPYTK